MKCCCFSNKEKYLANNNNRYTKQLSLNIKYYILTYRMNEHVTLFVYYSLGKCMTH